MSSMHTILTQPLLVAAALLSIGGLIHFVRRFGAAWTMRRWYRTSGRVLSAEMRRGKKKSPDGSLLYDPVLRYSYTVGQLTYESSSFTHPAVSNAAHLATQFITHISKNAEVPVYYHPRNPAEAVVRPVPWHGPAVGMGACAFLLVLALGLHLSLA
ncbi:MAG TPA: DUF3592 domain-containing protein [Prosthecobacter sp.]